MEVKLGQICCNIITVIVMKDNYGYMVKTYLEHQLAYIETPIKHDVSIILNYFNIIIFPMCKSMLYNNFGWHICE